MYTSEEKVSGSRGKMEAQMMRKALQVHNAPMGEGGGDAAQIEEEITPAVKAPLLVGEAPVAGKEAPISRAWNRVCMSAMS